MNLWPEYFLYRDFACVVMSACSSCSDRGTFSSLSLWTPQCARPAKAAAAKKRPLFIFKTYELLYLRGNAAVGVKNDNKLGYLLKEGGWED